MHSFWQRSNALLTYAGTLLAFMCLATTATDYLHRSDPYVDVSYHGVEGMQKEFDHDRAYIVLNMTADLRSVFSWNTKQVHAFVTVNFASPRNPVNSMVMWSATVERREHGLLVVPHLRAGYPYSITDQGHELLGREFEVTVAWNVMPRVGRLYTGRRSFSGFRLPEEYIKAEKGNIRRSGGRTGADKEAAEAAVRQIAGS